MKKFMLRCRKSIVLLMKLGLYMVLMATFFLLMSIHNPQILVMSRTMAITIFTFVIIILLLTNIYGHYEIGTRKSRPIVYSLSLSVIFTDVITFIALYIMNTNDANNREFLKEDIFLLFIIMYLQVLAVIIFTYGGQAVYFSIVDPERCLIITDSLDTLDGLMRGIKKYKKQYNVVGVVEYDNHDLWERIDQVDTVFLNNVPLQQKNEIVESCYRKNKNIYYNPEIIDVVNIHSHHVLLDDVSVISAEVKELSAEQKLIKRAGDIFISLFAIIVGSPIMLGCALAIKLNDGGSVLFRQNRVTKDNRIFTIYKFRTMKEGADLHLCTTDDERVTKVGKVLRKYRLDELPQLFNILKGDMSLVGPRPEMTQFVYVYMEDLPQFGYRHRVKAGLTGYAQVMGKYNTSSKDKLAMDLMYIENFSIWNDVKILFQTVLVLFKAEDSTEGFMKGDKQGSMEEMG